MGAHGKGGVSKMQECAACGGTFPTNGHGVFATHDCSMRGKAVTLTGTDWRLCPEHSALAWSLGPYSAFPQCPIPGCATGTPTKEGKPRAWFYRVGRDYKAPTPVVTKSPEATTPITPTQAPTIPTQAKEATVTTPTPTPTPIPIPQTERDRNPYPANHQTSVDFAKAETQLKALGSLGDAIQTYVEGRAYEMATECAISAVTKLMEGQSGTAVHEWKVNGAAFAKIEGAHHKALPRLLKLYAGGFRNFLIVGPAGSGKTTLASQLAKSLGTAFASVSCTAGMSESALTGRAIPNLTTGETAYQGTLFVTTFEEGGVFLLDEVDAADPNVMLAINSALANGHMPLPNRADLPEATRHADSVIICAANTWGTGADRQYVGRNQLDAAFLDRFVGTTIAVDYDRDLESQLVGDAHICARVWEIRSKVESLKIRRVVGTRFLLSLTRLVKCVGETLDAGLTACTVGWTPDERTKVGIRTEGN